MGHLSAEADDEFLFDCFVSTTVYREIIDSNSPAMILCGRTGAGKTAILRMIRQQMEYTSIVDLFDMSMNYVANSDIIRFLESLNVDLDLFFQVLWRHVLCIEFIRMRHNICDEKGSKSLFYRINDIFKANSKRKKALEYLKKWEGKFWITMDENIRELTEKLEKDAKAEFGGEIAKFKADAGYTRKLSSEARTQYQARAKKIVNATQLAELSQVLDLLSEESCDEIRKYYILVDRLDEGWVDDDIRFRLVRALVECLRSFRKIEKLKVVVAIRTDVIERVIQETSQLGFQREKYDDYILQIRWSENELHELIRHRIRRLYKRKYTKDDVKYEDVFPLKIGKESSFEFILERTQHRPRDVLSYMNICLEESEGKTTVTQKIVRSSEGEYSRRRILALIEEWQSTFPTLQTVFEFCARMPARFYIRDIKTGETVNDLVIRVASYATASLDPIYIAAKSCLEDGDIGLFIDRVFSELYRIGAVALKLRPNEHFLYSYKHRPVIGPSLITDDTRVYFHPMVHYGLNIA